MSIYSDYLKEVMNKELLETSEGFALFSFPDQHTCYIEEIFISPKSRNNNLASNMADQIAIIARERGCNTLMGSVNTSIRNPTTSIEVLIRYGFKFVCSTPECLFFRKEI